jgi:Ca2+-binding RTX toxin-like protein
VRNVKNLLGALVLAVALLSLLPAGAADAGERPTCQGRLATIVGTTHNISGTAGNDVIVVRSPAGINYIRARGGDDLVCGGDGHDFLYDGQGHDRFYGGKGQDFLEQKSVERDFFDGGPGFDAVDYFGRSVDQYVNLRNRKADDGAPGEDDRLLSVGSVYTGPGNDVLIGGDEPNTDGHSFPAFSAYYLFGGAGDDLIIGGPLGDYIGGGPGNDVIEGRGGRDFIDATDDTGIDGYQHYADQVDGGRVDERNVVLCDELDVVTNASQTRGC